MLLLMLMLMLMFVVVAVSRQNRQTGSAISASRSSFFTHYSHSKHPLHTTTHNILEKTYTEHVLQAYNVLHHALQTTKSGLGMPYLIWCHKYHFLMIGLVSGREGFKK